MAPSEMALELQDVRLLKNPRFRRLLEARVLGHVAQNAMVYALLILVVEDSGSSVDSTLLVMAFTIPTVILGIPAGTIADFLPRRLTMATCQLLRAAVALALVYYEGDLLYIYLLAALASSIGQFFSPAESAVVPAVVRRDQLPAASSLMVLTQVLAQTAGMVALAPVLIKLIDPRAVFIACAALFMGATYVIGWMATDLTPGRDAQGPSLGFIEATKEGFRILRTNRHAYLAVVYMTIAAALSKVIVVLLPKYTKDVLHISTADAVFVAAPAAIGAGLGLLLTPALIRRLGAWRVVAVGFGIFLAGLIGLGFVFYVRDFIEANLNLGISFVEKEVGVSSVITVTMLLAMPLGFAFTLVSVASRVVVNEQAPPEAQGRVYAIQMSLGDLVSLLPLVIVGVVADMVGARATLLASAIAAVLAAGYLTFSQRFGPPAAPPAAAPEPAPQAT
jgi:MFS family permease